MPPANRPDLARSSCSKAELVIDAVHLRGRAGTDSDPADRIPWACAGCSAGGGKILNGGAVATTSSGATAVTAVLASNLLYCVSLSLAA
jgi:hypothetical protein